MPQKIVCGGCGEVFYSSKDLKPPEEIIQQLKGICPKCGKELSFDPRNIDIRASLEENRNR